MAHFKADFLQFFIDLAANNHKDWFDENRKRYESTIKNPFKTFVQLIIDEIALLDPNFKGVEAKDCIFRINRDIRFSKDKTPYKLNVSAVVAPEGKKSRAINGIYFEFGPEHVRVYGGIYEIDKEDLLSVREGIAANMKAFKQLYDSTDFKSTFGEIRGEKNKFIPKDLSEASKIEPLIFNKQFYFFAEFEPEIILRENLSEILIDCYKKGRPIEQFLTKFIAQK